MIIYKPYASEYETHVLDLLEPLWGHLDMQSRLNYFQWKYTNNPACEKVLAFVVIDTATEKIIGFRGFFPSIYTINSKTVRVASFSDVVIHPDYRKRGLFEKITRFAMQELEKYNVVDFYNTISNNTWPTSKGYLKMGSVPLALKKDLYRVCLLPGRSKSKEIRLENSRQAYAREIANLHASSHNKNTLAIEKDEPFISWRYQNPAATYYFVYAWQNNQLAGYISYYKISEKRCYILDYAAFHQKTLSLMVRYLAAQSKCRLIQTWSISKTGSELQMWKKAGFRNFNRLFQLLGKQEAPPVLIRPASTEYSEADFFIGDRDVLNEGNWDINLICSDGV